ncbi:MAG: Gram-negative bacterial TonB protein C-terminal [Candidatus Eremiobacteraeota bacterium]|nr:Gram-negative bacterial TonB protein C-terminal [Candidatus Eremiobacteraeota bacterium]
MIVRHLNVLVAVGAVLAATMFCTASASGAPTTCSLARAVALERQAKAKADSEDMRALYASIDYQRAAGEIVRCALSSDPPAPRWRLYAAAQADEQQSIRMDLANGTMRDPNMLTYRTGLMHRFDVAVYHDPAAPQAAKAAALEQWDEWSLASTPQFQRAERRRSCHQMIETLAAGKVYLQEFVTFADGFIPKAKAASGAHPVSRARKAATTSPSRSAECARPNVPARALRVVEPDTPAVAQQQGIHGDVNVEVSLDEQSRVVGTRIISSPSAVLNNAAIAAAAQSVFQTEIRNCKPIAEKFIFTVTFDAL